MTLFDIAAEPRFAHLLDMRVEFDPAQIFPTPTGTRMTFVIKRGRAEGARIAGDILAGGGDWVVLGSDGVARLDVRATLRTDDDRYRWINAVHTVAINQMSMSEVHYKVFEVL